jgi:predicted phage terminase large subunit-like protein
VTLADLFGTNRPTTLGRREVDLSAAVRGLQHGQLMAVAEKRRTRSAAGIEGFCLTYLPHHFTKPLGEHHVDLFRAIDRPNTSKTQGKRIVRVEPRMFGKTTVISLALPLMALAYQRKQFIMLVSEASGGSHANLATLVYELENNEMLLKDFPHLAPARDTKGQLIKWTDEEIVVASGAHVVAKGMGSRMRGIKRGASRPDLGIVDDPESPETAASFVTRQRHKKWFGGTFLGLGGEFWDVYVVGNLPHHDCLVADLLKSEEWDGKLYRAINLPKRRDERYTVGNLKEDESPLWPERWSLEALDRYRADPTVGELGFAREMLNDPRDDKDKPFDTSKFTYFDYEPSALPAYRFIGTFLDPAGGEHPHEARRGRRDFACIVTAGMTRDNHIDILNVVMTKQTPDHQVDLFLTEYEIFKSRKMAVEENIFKNLIGPTMAKRARERKLYPAILTQHQTKNKLQRILSIQPLVANGTIRFARYLKAKVPDYFGQFDDVPGEHDDGPDATEGLVRLLESSVAVGAPSGVTGTSYWRKS